MEDQAAFSAWYENDVRSGRAPGKAGGCPLDMPKPAYPAFCGCGFFPKREEKKDCFFYHEEHWMEGAISTCSYHNGGLGNCPCKDCKKYISKSDAHKLIVAKVNENATE